MARLSLPRAIEAYEECDSNSNQTDARGFRYRCRKGRRSRDATHMKRSRAEICVIREITPDESSASHRDWRFEIICATECVPSIQYRSPRGANATSECSAE